MFEGYKPTKAERAAIEKAFAIIHELTRRDFRTEQFAKDEAHGYGHASDRVPLIAAKALCCKWFLYGFDNKGETLAQTFHMRPAAIWFQGNGAKTDCLLKSKVDAITAAVTAHEAAFRRMLDSNKAI